MQALVMMRSQPKPAGGERQERAKQDYMINLKSELELSMLHEKIDHLNVSAILIPKRIRSTPRILLIHVSYLRNAL